MSINVLMVGTGECTTGYVHDAASTSDKSAGVVALTMFDLRRRGLVDRVLMAGTSGIKFPAIRTHLKQAIQDVYHGIDAQFESFPDDTCARDTEAYRDGLRCLTPGDVVTIFTPDDTHFDIAMDAVQRGCHVLIAKPIVKTLDEHQRLKDAAAEHGVLVAMEVHKRWDPIYADARDRISSLGDFGFFQSYMSQPKSQLDTFRSWAGRSSDISYYLNAHHVDFTVWAAGSFARPVRVQASGATGVARSQGLDTEDTITLTVDWENLDSGNMGTAVYTASWIAPQSDVHSQQRFFYLGHGGEVIVDQAHRGYSVATDEDGFAACNPLFMKYTPDSSGHFAGQSGYGYRSIEDFVKAALAIRTESVSPSSFNELLASIDRTTMVTAILEAGRRSLDQGTPIEIEYDSSAQVQGFRSHSAIG
ncbi:MAG: Gfo/Idh/MocA family oxidoreductase [Planctomycetota bacterium]